MLPKYFTAIMTSLNQGVTCGYINNVLLINKKAFKTLYQINVVWVFKLNETTCD